MNAEGIDVLREIRVKARVTEDLKKRLAGEIQEAIRVTDAELAQLDFQVRRVLPALEKQNQPQAAVVRQQVEAEHQKRLERKSGLLERLKDVARLEIGSEIVHGTVQGPVRVKVGDDWEKVTSAEILLVDGIVAAVREGDAPPGDRGEE